MIDKADKKKAEAYRLIYSLEYRVEDVGTVAGRLLSIGIPELENLVRASPQRATYLAQQMLDAIGEKPLSEEHLRESFPAYCALIGVPWHEDEED